MLNKLLLFANLCLFAAISFPAVLASESPSGEVTSLESFLEERERIEENLTGGGAYFEISSGDRADVIRNLDLIQTELERADGIENMSGDAKIRVFNAQEHLNELLTEAADDSRMRCERRRRIGSNISSTYCQTYADRKRRAELDSREIHRLMSVRLPLNEP